MLVLFRSRITGKNNNAKKKSKASSAHLKPTAVPTRGPAPSDKLESEELTALLDTPLNREFHHMFKIVNLFVQSGNVGDALSYYFLSLRSNLPNLFFALYEKRSFFFFFRSKNVVNNKIS